MRHLILVAVVLFSLGYTSGQRTFVESDFIDSSFIPDPIQPDTLESQDWYEGLLVGIDYAIASIKGKQSDTKLLENLNAWRNQAVIFIHKHEIQKLKSEIYDLKNPGSPLKGVNPPIGPSTK